MRNDNTLSEAETKAIASGLARVLADTFRLYQKTHTFHWNVEGPQFGQLHTLFEEQYREMWEAVDEVAERIRALGHYVPGSPADFQQLSSIREERAVPSAPAMIRQLVEGHETVVRTIRESYDTPDQAGDAATTNLYDDRLSTHEKHAWMLRSHLVQQQGDTVADSPLDRLR